MHCRLHAKDAHTLQAPPHAETDQPEVIASLYLEALRQGQSLWYRVASSSMRPLLHINDAIHIEPASAQHIQIGDVAAFETTHGLVVHRIVARRQQGTHLQLLQMADSEVRPNWIQEEAVVGRVIAIRRGSRSMQLQSPLARTCGTFIALIRYQLSLHEQPVLVKMMLSACSCIALRMGSCCICLFCLSSQ
jgi:signal peptidase I